MASHVLIDLFLAPVEPPSESHVCADDVIACRASEDGLVVQEIYRRNDAFLGFRYFAWVAWRDAGNTPRSHSWYEVSPDQALVTDDYSTAVQCAESHATSKGISLSAWTNQ